MTITVGVLALQGGFAEHVSMLKQAAARLIHSGATTESLDAVLVRTPAELASCDALVIPGGESTTIALIAARSGLMEPLRDFVRVQKKPTWGTCAGLVLLSSEASGTKIGGQELIGGLDVRVHRNHFGHQKESFIADVHMPFLESESVKKEAVTPFPGVFIRAPVVEALLQPESGEEDASDSGVDVQQHVQQQRAQVRILAVLPGHRPTTTPSDSFGQHPSVDGDVVAVQQNNILGTSFHPELTGDVRLHEWWLRQILQCC